MKTVNQSFIDHNGDKFCDRVKEIMYLCIVCMHSGMVCSICSIYDVTWNVASISPSRVHTIVYRVLADARVFDGGMGVPISGSVGHVQHGGDSLCVPITK